MPLDQFLLELVDDAGPLPGAHRAPQLVGFAGSETRRHDHELHGLLLKQRHAEGLAQDVAHGFAGVFHRLLAVASPQVGVDHLPLDRTGADDRHLDHQVVKLLRLQPRQHAHLGPRFDLKHTDRVGPLNHLVNSGVFGGNRGQSQRLAGVLH